MKEWLLKKALLYVIKSINRYEDVLLKTQNALLADILDEATDALERLFVKHVAHLKATEPSKVTPNKEFKALLLNKAFKAQEKPTDLIKHLQKTSKRKPFKVERKKKNG